MKKISLLLVCLLVGITTTFAQRAGDKSVGLNLNYASEASFGMGVNFQYNITDAIRIEPEFNCFFPHDDIIFWDLGLNAAYLFPVAKDVVLYPLVGIGYAHSVLDADPSNIHDGSFEAKFGGGAEFRLTPNWKVKIEPKYQIADHFNQFVLTAGIAYCF